MAEKRRLFINPNRLSDEIDSNGELILTSNESHYLSRVMRMRSEDLLEVIDGKGHLWNAKIVEQKKIYHGIQSNIKVITNKSLFKKGKIFKVGRYHSLKLKEPFKSYNFEITMRCLNSKVAMAFENKKEKIYGFQFHPESFLTINGNLLIKKILSA